MNSPVEYCNETVSAAHIQAMISLISIISTHFLLTSFTVISDLDLTSILNFEKMASNLYFETKFDNLVQSNGSGNVERGYIIIQKFEFDFLKLIKDQPKLIVAIFITEQKNPTPTEFSQEIIIPPATSFFVVLLSKHPKGFLSTENSAALQGKFFRLYKPASNFTTRTFLLMFYGGVNKTWYWQNKGTDWNSYAKDIRDMSEITVTVALATPQEKSIAITNFLKSKSSLFWRTMAKFLKFRIVIHVERISPQIVKNVTSVYLKLLMTVADGLGVLPVMSSERNHPSLKFLVTGLDSKYHLLVKAPEYVYSWQSTLKPFALESWLCLGLTILLISFILKIVTIGEKLNDLNASNCFLIVFGFICSQSSPIIPTDMSARLVCFTALLFSIIIYQFYISNFCSLLSTKEISLPFTSLEQLIAKRTHSLYVHPDTAIYAHILKAESGVFKKLYDEILNKDPFHQLKVSNRIKALSKVCKNTGAILGLPHQTLHMKELTCSVIPVNSGYFPTSIATAIRKSFPFQSQFKFVHLRLLEIGVTHKFRDEFLNFNQQRPIKADVTNEPVSLNHVALPCALYAVFIVLSFLAFCFEIFTSKALKSPNRQFLGNNLFSRRKQLPSFEHP